MRKIAVVLHRPGKPDKHWMVVHPQFGEPKFYQEAVSFSYFRSRELKRAFPYAAINGSSQMADVIFCSVQEDWETWDKWNAKVGIPVPKRTEIAGVFKFYEAIGYDYKKQRYTDKTNGL